MPGPKKGKKAPPGKDVGEIWCCETRQPQGTSQESTQGGVGASAAASGGCARAFESPHPKTAACGPKKGKKVSPGKDVGELWCCATQRPSTTGRHENGGTLKERLARSVSFGGSGPQPGKNPSPRPRVHLSEGRGSVGGTPAVPASVSSSARGCQPASCSGSLHKRRTTPGERAVPIAVPTTRRFSLTSTRVVPGSTQPRGPLLGLPDSDLHAFGEKRDFPVIDIKPAQISTGGSSFLLFRGFEFHWGSLAHRLSRFESYVKNGLGYQDAARGARFRLGPGCAGDHGHAAMPVVRVSLPPSAAYFEARSQLRSQMKWHLDSATNTADLVVDADGDPTSLQYVIPYEELIGQRVYHPTISQWRTPQIEDYRLRRVFLQGFRFQTYDLDEVPPEPEPFLLRSIRVEIDGYEFDDQAQELRVTISSYIEPGVALAAGMQWTLGGPFLKLCDLGQAVASCTRWIVSKVRIGIVGFAGEAQTSSRVAATSWPLEGPEPHPVPVCSDNAAPRVLSSTIPLPTGETGGLVALEGLSIVLNPAPMVAETLFAGGFPNVCSEQSGRLMRRFAVSICATQWQGSSVDITWKAGYTNWSALAYPIAPTISASFLGLACPDIRTSSARFGALVELDDQGLTGSECEPHHMTMTVRSSDVRQVFAGSTYTRGCDGDGVCWGAPDGVDPTTELPVTGPCEWYWPVDPCS